MGFQVEFKLERIEILSVNPINSVQVFRGRIHDASEENNHNHARTLRKNS